ncbi:hypothetical protein NV379_06915 [Paenibacillus sp. N1-5-1-14]|uniref:hypothetical protein n=1 Tax=Paenibacillus radicibacter TaxID=2972488 RepID=UPI002158A5AC|nr:hypothetical protein [Paenibacillus radicibacter]MCR8642390.1 hypothetical protein [Paenibacillus radicibacter]
MAYQPIVVEATKVSDNPKNGLFEITVVLKDRNHCRVFFERDAVTGAPRPTDINRLYKEPCYVCKKDFQCDCMDSFLQTIGAQALTMVGM